MQQSPVTITFVVSAGAATAIATTANGARNICIQNISDLQGSSANVYIGEATVNPSAHVTGSACGYVLRPGQPISVQFQSYVTDNNERAIYARCKAGKTCYVQVVSGV